MRRITALIVVLVAMATAAVFPLAASADHGGAARRRANQPAGDVSRGESGREAPRGASRRLALAYYRAVSGSTDSARRRQPPEKEGDMRRVTALIVVLAATSAAFPLVASAGHGGTHGGSPIVRAI